MVDWKEILLVFASYTGSFIAALIGALARHFYHPDGFSIKRLLIDLPFICLVSMAAGGLGKYLELPDQATYALAGTASWLSSQLIAEFAKTFVRKQIEKIDDVVSGDKGEKKDEDANSGKN